jgi:hypothetical protein
VAGIRAAYFTTYYNVQREARCLDHEQKLKLGYCRQKAYATVARITRNVEVTEPYVIGDLVGTHSE